MNKIIRWIIFSIGAVFLLYAVCWVGSFILPSKESPDIKDLGFFNGLIRVASILIWVSINWVIGYYYFKFVGVKLLKL